MINNYTKQQYKRKKQKLRIRLGILQFIHKPLLNLLWIFIIMTSILTAWGGKTAMDYLAKDVDIPQMIYPVFSCTITFITVLLLILLIFSMFEWIGERTARWSESCLVLAFDAKHLRHGHPVLMDKYKIKGTPVTVREFYSPIPYKAWIEKQDSIADAMNVHFVEPIQYGGKNHTDGNRIIIKTAVGRKNTGQGVLYDEEL